VAKSKVDREKRISEFVLSLWRKSEHDTLKDRERISQNLNLFAGKQDWPTHTLPWQSKPFLHMFAPLCRRMAESASDIIFDKEDFLEYEAHDETNPGEVRLAEIMSKVLRHYNDKARIQSLLYDFLIALGACGFGVLKVTPEYRIVYSGDAVLKKVSRQKTQTQKTVGSKVENAWETIPQDEAGLTKLIQDEFDDMFGEGNEQITRSLGPKKRYELFIVTKTINPLNYGYDPDIDSLQETAFDIQRHYIKLQELHPLFESGFLDKSKRDKLKNAAQTNSFSGSHINDSFEGQKINLRDQLTDHSKYSKVRTVYEYFGDFWDEEGTILEENKHFVVDSGGIVLRDKDNEDWAQESPFIKVVCSPRPFKPVGAGVADNAVDQQVLINEMFGMFVDMLKLAIHPPSVFDETGIRDIDELEEEGLHPGQLIRGFKKADDIFSPIPNPGVAVAPTLFQTLELLNLYGEKGAGVDTASANPASRARISAKEIQANVGRSGQSQNALARNLDENLLEPYAHAIAKIILQHGLDRENLEQLAQEGVISQEELTLLSDIPEIERYLECKRKLKIKIRGFRERIERIQRLGSSTDFLMSLSSFPPDVLSKINFTEALKDIADLYGFDSNRWIYQNTPTDKAREENTLLLNNQFLSVGEGDQHNLELPVHYEAVMQGLTQSLEGHIQEHLQALLAAGQPVPEMPPEVQEALGMVPAAPAPQPIRKTIRARRNDDGSIEGEVEEGPAETIQ
jgi:hypothetical protein